MMRVLHFADAHIDIANQHGRRDAQSGLPLRVLDFLAALDTIVDTAVDEHVDMVLFAGDAYRDRTPVPTFQREWGRRILRLSQAGIPTLLLVGNHDLSPAAGRAHALQEFDTLQIPHITVIDKPRFLGPQDLGGLPLQVLAMPWVTRSGLLAALASGDEKSDALNEEMEKRLGIILQTWMEQLDPSLPTILAAHATVMGAVYGNERTVMLGNDLVLPGAMVKDPRLDYVALGHIHKYQDLNEGSHPPVVYPGSIERVDFGEIQDDKYFVVAEIERGRTRVIRHKLNGRRFFDRRIKIEVPELVTQQIIAALPPVEEMEGAMLRLTVEYPHSLEPMIDEIEIRRCAEAAFEFHFVRKPQIEARARLQLDGQNIHSLSALDLLDLFWKSANPNEDMTELKTLADEIIHDSGDGAG